MLLTDFQEILIFQWLMVNFEHEGKEGSFLPPNIFKQTAVSPMKFLPADSNACKFGPMAVV